MRLKKLSELTQDSSRSKDFQRLTDNSILCGSDCIPYSNSLCTEIFQALRLESADYLSTLDINFDASLQKMSDNSWFSISCNSIQPLQQRLNISVPSSISSITGYSSLNELSESTNRAYGRNSYKKSTSTPPNKSIKIPVLPCKKLHGIWKKWLAAYRWVYNTCVAFLNSGEKLPTSTSLDQYIQLIQKETENAWTTCLGKTRQEAVCEAQSAFRQARKAMLAKPKKSRTKVTIKFRSCRDNSQVIQFKNDAFRSGTWFPTKTEGLFCIASGYEFPTVCLYGTELAYQRCQGGFRWFAIFPQYQSRTPDEYETKTNSFNVTSKVIAFDPGVRTFLTGFDGDNILEFGKKDIGRIIRLCLHLDKLISRKVKAKGKDNKKLRYKLGLGIKNLRVRIRNLVSDFHHKTSSFIVSNYKIVFLPTYKTSEMVFKAKRKINTKSTRQMLTWSFGHFAKHLEQMAKRSGVLVIRTNEAYTSKTCPNCGQIHQNLGGNKTFFCPHCGFSQARDWVGAINNLIKALTNLAFDIQGNQLVITCAG